MFVKICGLSNSIDAMAAAEAGADALGFVMGGNVLPVEVEPHAQTVREIIKRLPSTAASYIVTHLRDAADILALADYVGSAGIQVSEPLPVATLKAIRKETSRTIIKTVIVNGPSSLKNLAEVSPYCDYVLLDTQVAGYVGGTGVTSDWSLCRELVAASPRPVLLAGGLTPGNVGRSIAEVKPFGVDVSTGVSSYGSDYLRKDRKDPRKIIQFITTAKGGTI